MYVKGKRTKTNLYENTYSIYKNTVTYKKCTASQYLGIIIPARGSFVIVIF